MTDSDRLTYHAIRRRILAARSAELRAELAATDAELAASARIIRALVPHDDTRPHVVHVDGASRGNPGAASAAYVLRNSIGVLVAERAECIGHRTSNEAEWEAVVLGLERALALGVRQLELRSDSTLVVGGLSGRHRIRARKLKPLQTSAAALVGRFESFRAVHVPRSENKRADALANAALDAAARAA